MSVEVETLLDWEVAWVRSRGEMVRAGVRPAFELELLEQDAGSWVCQVAASVRDDRYSPSVMEVSELPKTIGIVRPLAYLVPADRLVYTALVGACFEAIFEGLAWSQGLRDFAHVLNSPTSGRSWIRSRYKTWTAFRRASKLTLKEGYSYVVFTDVAAFYENIDIGILISDLNGLGAPQVVTQQLSVCLNRWAQVGGRGLPQGLEASDILSKVYLNLIDRALSIRGVVHHRYSDDMRLFCHDQIVAQQTLVELSDLLRRRGLTLQGAKSEIVRADVAFDKIEGVVPILRTVRQKFVADMNEFYDLDDPYGSIAEIDAALEDNPDDAPIEIIREAFQTYFIDDPRPRFDKTLFRFLLNRLGKARDRTAIPHVTLFLEGHPEETETVLSYLYRLDALSAMDSTLAAFLASPQGRVYRHQTYQIMRWVSLSSDASIPELLQIARELAHNPATPRHLRGFCRKIVGVYGDAADLELLQNAYDHATDSLEQAQIMCSLARMERQRRNAFLARAARDGDLNRRASTLVRV